MSVTINHGYTPVQTDKYVDYEYETAIDDTHLTQLSVPAYYDGITKFGGNDLYLDQNSVVHDMTECEYTDTSNNVRKYYVEYDSGYYWLKYTINNGTPSTIIYAAQPIYFGWYTPSVNWQDGVTPGFQASINGVALYIAGAQTHFYSFSGGTVRVAPQVTLTLTDRTYDVIETVTITQ